MTAHLPTAPLFIDMDCAGMARYADIREDEAGEIELCDTVDDDELLIQRVIVSYPPAVAVELGKRLILWGRAAMEEGR